LLPLYSLANGEENVKFAAKQATAAAIGLEECNNKHIAQIEALQAKICDLVAENESVKQHCATLEIEKSTFEGKILSLQNAVNTEKVLNAEVCWKLEAMSKCSYFTYNNLAPGGQLDGYAKDFTYFQMFESNDEFLAVLNWDDKNTGDGLAVGMRCYGKVSKAERAGEKPAPNETKHSVSWRSLDWKTEYLVFSFYCLAGMTQ